MSKALQDLLFTDTPDCLQRLGLPANYAFPLKMPRVFYRFQGERLSKHGKRRRGKSEPKNYERVRLDKKLAVGMMMSATAGGSLPQALRPREWTKAVSHHELAQHAGYRFASSFSRNIRHLYRSGPDLVDVDKRGRKVQRLGLLDRERDYAQPNRYRLRIKERASTREDQKGLYKHGGRFEIQASDVAHLFDLAAGADRWAGDRWFDGYIRVPAWVWDPRLPLRSRSLNRLERRHKRGADDRYVSLLARLSMTFLCGCGLIDRGWVDVWMTTLGSALGCTPETARVTLRPWQRLGLIRVIPQKREKGPDGKWRPRPLRIVFLPSRQISEKQALLQHEALQERARRLLNERQRELWGQAAFDIHAAVLREYTGGEKHVKTMVHDCMRRFLAAGIPQSIADALLDRPPERSRP